jgi:DNA mismatch repair protein MutL
MKINVLPPHVYNLLSAGEVVENPASIVKELAENSIDAEATKISVEITGGGIDDIVVTDNGAGCAESELPKVFLPHATSKITSAADIDAIASLGFRGEAMASIAAVAKAEFISKPKSQPYAAKILSTGDLQIVSANDGTTVRISNLFYNTPARKKFLRTANAEKNSVTDVIYNIIFSNPELHIEYIADGKTVIDYRGTGLPSAIKQIYNVDETDLLPVDYRNGAMAVSGLISNIKLSKNNKTRQVVIINGRVVNGGLVAFAVNEVMSNYLMTGEYPVFVLSLKIDRGIVDVNVHPQKKEVRFEDRGTIIAFMKKAISKTMDEYFAEANKALSGKHGTVPIDSVDFFSQRSPTLALQGKSFDPNGSKISETVFLESLKLFSPDGDALRSAPNILADFEIVPDKVESKQISVLNENEFNILGQIFETYLLVSTADNLIIIDQHAMAERINYDEFKKQIDSNVFVSQPLLTPILVDLTPKELTNFEKIKPHLIALGFDVFEFGGNSVRVFSVPIVMDGAGVKEFLRVLLADKDVTDDKLSDMLKDKIASIACKASIKAGATLSPEQIELFIKRYQTSNIVPLCPHGRPIMLAYSKSRMESLFARK